MLPSTWQMHSANQEPGIDTSVVSISPDGEYLAFGKQVLRGSGDMKRVCTLPSPCAALTSQRAWTYEWRGQQGKAGTGGYRCVLQAYTLDARPMPLDAFHTPFLFPGHYAEEDTWLQSVHTCCHPHTGHLAIVHGTQLHLTTLNGNCFAATVSCNCFAVVVLLQLCLPLICYNCFAQLLSASVLLQLLC